MRKRSCKPSSTKAAARRGRPSQPTARLRRLRVQQTAGRLRPSRNRRRSTLAVPADEPTQLGEADKLYLDFVKEIGPKFKQVGEEVVRKLIKLSLVTPANVKQMASFQPEMLKTLAAAS